MRERPILFNGPMVRAILDGRKTVTRRTMKPQPVLNGNFWELGGAGWSDRISNFTPVPGHSLAERCPFGQPGDRLWVRESFSGPYCMECADALPAVPPSQWPKESPIWFWADGDPAHGDWTRPRPSIHMPRWAARILLEITAVRVERLQDISEEQATAEGAEPYGLSGLAADEIALLDAPLKEPSNPNRNGFALLWNSTGGDWDANPWVWVVEFKRVEVCHA